MGNVRVIKPFLSLAEGTELWFNEKSGRYEFKSRDEDSSADFKAVNEYSISLEPWLVEDNIGKYFSEIQIEENMATKLPLDQIEPIEASNPTCKEIEWGLDDLTKDLLIAKINAESAERVAKIHTESAERIAQINNANTPNDTVKIMEKDWGVHSDGYQGGY